MGFFKKIKTVFKASEGFRLLERTEVDLKIEADIVAYGIKKFAVSDYGDLYLKIGELGGFIMLETIIVSDTNLKSKKGTTLSFLKDNQILTLESDEHIIESDFSNTVKKAITKIDYNISKEYKLSINEMKDLKKYLVYSLEIKKLQKVKDVIYDKTNGKIKNIPRLQFNNINRNFTIKRCEKRVSTLKSLGNGNSKIKF